MFSLFILAMDLKKDNGDIQTQEAHFMEMFLNLYKRQEELKALLAGNLTKKRLDNNKDDQVEQLQAEMERMRTQMISQMALIQILARGQEELRILVSKLYQDSRNHIKKRSRLRINLLINP